MSATTAAAPLKLRVLTVNTHKGFTLLNRRFVLPELRDAVRNVNADVVFLQEVMGQYDGRPALGASWPQTPHYEFLADEIWPQFAYGRNAVYQEGDHGNAVLSKYPIVDERNHDVSIGLDRHEARGLLHCTLSVPGFERPVHAISVHLGLLEAHRRHQLEALCRVVVNLVPTGVPLLVAGDFNDWRDRAHRVLDRCAGLQEVFVNAHGRAARTFPAWFPMLRLDRIYVRNARAHRPVALPRHPWARLSDHAPLAAEVLL
ncbi:endonuclease/exonuclease/phosphatase family protein [Ideonella sp.]|uniref:endonuclease/exonuclease/phosphatase family protein n=1 Tax=Ideonella sp. TaxID=1929293 RepID=UPI002B476044|nr:endonuclease/exonuclease/phosphatase family protein [Ideonella sp.]HJV70766.1 endonuclease/exonuclease/phosphatase family protein [Ideonella sp.]